MTAESETASTAGQEANSPIICPKCGQPNPRDVGYCVHCQRHLYISCRECGHFNLRANARCDECLAPLHHPHAVPPPSYRLFWPICWRYDPQRKWMIPFQLIMLFGAVAVTVILTVNFPDLFAQAERFLFAESFNAYPVNMPLRLAVSLDIVTSCLFCLPPIGLLLILAWLTRKTFPAKVGKAG